MTLPSRKYKLSIKSKDILSVDIYPPDPLYNVSSPRTVPVQVPSLNFSNLAELTNSFQILQIAAAYRKIYVENLRPKIAILEEKFLSFCIKVYFVRKIIVRRA
jgi:hypothetical protein